MDRFPRRLEDEPADVADVYYSSYLLWWTSVGPWKRKETDDTTDNELAGAYR
jgi:hypothetical protein